MASGVQIASGAQAQSSAPYSTIPGASAGQSEQQPSYPPYFNYPPPYWYQYNAQPNQYPPQQGAYPPQQGAYSPQQGAYPPQQCGGYPPPQGGWYNYQPIQPVMSAPVETPSASSASAPISQIAQPVPSAPPSDPITPNGMPGPAVAIQVTPEVIVTPGAQVDPPMDPNSLVAKKHHHHHHHVKEKTEASVQLHNVKVMREQQIKQEKELAFFNHLGDSTVDRDFILIIDKSGSMKSQSDNRNAQGIRPTRWEEAKEAVKILAPEICKHDKDGVTVVFFSSECYKEEGITDARKINKLFERYQPGDYTNLAGALTMALKEFDYRKPLTILVITDGQPEDGYHSTEYCQNKVKNVIIDASWGKVDGRIVCPGGMKNDADLSISIIQIGEDPNANKYLKVLDAGLTPDEDQLVALTQQYSGELQYDDAYKAKYAKFDIVDTKCSEQMKGMSFHELIMKSITS